VFKFAVGLLASLLLLGPAPTEYDVLILRDSAVTPQYHLINNQTKTSSPFDDNATCQAALYKQYRQKNILWCATEIPDDVNPDEDGFTPYDGMD
jgi:hypothetical protein